MMVNITMMILVNMYILKDQPDLQLPHIFILLDLMVVLAEKVEKAMVVALDQVAPMVPEDPTDQMDPADQKDQADQRDHPDLQALQAHQVYLAFKFKILILTRIFSIIKRTTWTY